MSKKNFETIIKDNEQIIDEGSLIFPKKLKGYINDMQESMSFIVLKPRSTNITVDRTTKQSKNTTQQFPLKYIILPIRKASDNLNNNFREIEGGEFIRMNDFAGLERYAKWKFYKLGMKAVSSKLSVLPTELIGAASRQLTGGNISNPKSGLFSTGHSRRFLSLSYEFLKPESREDEDTLRMILDIFNTNISEYGEYTIKDPIFWDIDFISFPNYSGYLRMRNCGLRVKDVNYGGVGEAFTAMESGFPLPSFDLEFIELDFATKDNLIMTNTSGVGFKN